jgi:predicted transcriptional regulator
LVFIDNRKSSLTIRLNTQEGGEPLLPSLSQSNVRKINVTEIAKRRGMNEREVENHIKGLVEQGLIKKVGKNKYEVTPLIKLFGGLEELNKEIKCK